MTQSINATNLETLERLYWTDSNVIPDDIALWFINAGDIYVLENCKQPSYLVLLRYVYWHNQRARDQIDKEGICIGYIKMYS